MTKPKHHRQPATVTKHPTIAGDLIWGAKHIGAEIGVDERKAFYLLDQGHIPARKIGSLWVASRRQLRAALCGDETAAA
jgi:hypothetical protein